MKSFLVSMVGYLVLFAVWFAALFSTGEGGGMGNIMFEHDIGTTWMYSIATIMSNFVVFLNIVLTIVTTIIFLSIISSETYISTLTDSLVEKHGIRGALHKVRFKRFNFYLISIPSWIIFIASGWLITAVIFILSTAVVQLQQSHQRDFIKDRYFKNEDTDSSDTPAPNGLDKRPI